MIAALLLAAQAAPAAPDDIVVLGRKLQMIEVDIKAPRRNGKLELQRCRVTRPSGIAELDAIPCGAAQDCIVESPASRKELERCVEARSQVRLDAVVVARRAGS